MATSKMMQWSIDRPDSELKGMSYTEASIPQVGENEVLVKFQAAALNYRDVAIAKGTFPFPHKYPIVPASDGAGEVIEIGSRVTEFKKGDTVLIIFNQAHQFGDIDPYAASTGVGGTIDGALRQYGVYNELGLVKAPKNLTAMEGSALPGAGLTSWNALYGLKPLKPGQIVLVQGTGGVSIFGLQLAKAAGAIVIATTSSAEKAERLTRLGADHVINYKTTPNWGEAARNLTPGQLGVDHILEVGGLGTLEQSLKCIKMDGIITAIGFLGSSDKPQPGLMDALTNICTVRGVFVGSRAMLKELILAVEANDIHPVIDESTFVLEQAKEAFEHLAAQKHFGKIRTTTGFHDVISSDSDAKFPAEKGRYVLYISYMCPFAHRATVVRCLKGLEPFIQLVVLDPELGPDGWFFSGRFGTAECDPLYRFRYIKDLYLKADPDYAGRFSVPLLWDKKNHTAVNNESSELMQMFYTAFDNLLPPQLQEPNLPGGGLYPNHLRKEIDEWNAMIHSNFNVGVYNVGMASSQDEYNQSVNRVFGTLDQIEYRLRSNGPYLFGDFLTETDLRLYTTVSRFDVAYYTIFRCNLKMIRLDYPAIDLWYRSLYYDKSSQTRDAFKATTDFFAVRSQLIE
ncbi:uncharacterized protein KD926_006533 [Aspergillus affinis]|uniref:uncharacterized protein n=1 Tax=Aspergillus affinis TaxID=1070780 RepID=UPI0022FF31FD|nr:uncharacterized protein KD926_006533 [Aspergillus affinis]KAI9041809.1 hypothetical protein KD926_006533 [Aspergillus affinis]